MESSPKNQRLSYPTEPDMTDSSLTPTYEDVVNANIVVFGTLAAHYNETEPHFLPENRARVGAVLKQVLADAGCAEGQGKMLDLGCGTGFMIDLGKPLCREIHGVDISHAMLSRVDKSGPCEVTLSNAETGSMDVPRDHFDVATAYSFLHHLKDIQPTLQRTFEALRNGGRLYADLEPNGYFLEAISALDRSRTYDPAVAREIEQVSDKDAEIAGKLNVPTGTFQSAEFGKSLKGGFFEEEILALLKSIGFSEARIGYNWFLGQGVLINDSEIERSQRLVIAAATDRVLQRSLPVSRTLYKYLAIHAVK